MLAARSCVQPCQREMRRFTVKGRPAMAVRVLAFFVLLAATLTATAGGQTSYWRITYDRVTVISGGNAERCTRLATQLTAFETILRELANWGASYELPPMAFYNISQQDARRAFLSDSELRRQAVANYRIYSKYVPGNDFNVAAIVDEGGSDDPLQSVLLLYAQGLQQGRRLQIVSRRRTRVGSVWASDHGATPLTVSRSRFADAPGHAG
jgi:hypothetical protein